MKIENVPKCVGVIMDGNRRWAKQKGLPVFEGHKEGYKKLVEFMDWCKEIGIKNAVAFAFSTENWNRTKEEVGYLMDLFKAILSKELKELKKKKVRLHFVGNLKDFSKDLQDLMKKAEKESADFTGPSLYLAMSYGGRSEILNACKKLIKIGKTEIEEKDIDKAMMTAGMPDPDLVIRTGGQVRTSGFLPWQTVYSELFFPKTFWPAFSKAEFECIVKEFSDRQRNFGK